MTRYVVFCPLTSPINKLADLHLVIIKLQERFPKSFIVPHSVNKLTLNEPAIKSSILSSLFAKNPNKARYIILKQISSLILSNYII